MEPNENLKEAEPTVSEEPPKPKREWRQIYITPESNLMSLFQAAVRQIKPGQTTLMATTINNERTQKLKMEIKDIYKFEFEWQDDNETFGVDVFKKIEVNNG